MLLSDLRRVGSFFDTWRDMDYLNREMNRLFSGERLPFAQGYPAVNVWADENEAVVTSEIPGIDPKDIDISVEGEMLLVRGSRKLDALKEGAKYHRQERDHGNFGRRIRLPFRVDHKSVEARYERGVLSINLHRLEADKPKKIEIKTD
jgi:HSP20 family protein